MNKDQKEFRKLAREAVKLYRQEKWGASIAKWDEIISLLQDGLIKASVYTRRGNAKEKVGDHKGALADYDRALEINPQYARAYSNRSISKNNIGYHKDALADCDRALKINPQYAKAYNNRGNAKSEMGDYKGALADYDRALEINPQNPMVYSNRGGVKSNMGDYESALADYRRALKIDPNHENARYNRNIALAMRRESRKGDKKIEEQLRAQQEKFERELQEQLRAQQEKFERELQERVRETQDKAEELREGRIRVIYSPYYEDELKAYEKKALERGKWVWGLSCALAVLAAFFYGLIAYFGIKEWQAVQSPMAMRSFSPLSLFPFVLVVTLALSPLAWVIRMLNRDKHKYWVLREDAEANLNLLRIIETSDPQNKNFHEKLWEKLFDHHDKRGSAHLIADWNHSDGGGNNFTIKPGGD